MESCSGNNKIPMIILLKHYFLLIKFNENENLVFVRSDRSGAIYLTECNRVLSVCVCVCVCNNCVMSLRVCKSSLIWILAVEHWLWCPQSLWTLKNTILTKKSRKKTKKYVWDLLTVHLLELSSHNLKNVQKPTQSPSRVQMELF